MGVTARSTPSEALAPYVPRLLVEWLRDHPGERVREVDGTMAFCDLSGFTALTDRLAKEGRVGAEEVSDALDARFARLLGSPPPTAPAW